MKNKLFKLSLVLLLAVCSIPQVWADDACFYSTGQWQIGYNDGSSDHWSGYKDNGATYTISGYPTTLKLIASNVNSCGNVKTNLDWWISYWSSLTARDDGAGNFWSIYVNWNGDHNNYLDCNDYDMIANARHPVGNDTLFMIWSYRGYNRWTGTAKIIFTIPGFKDVPASKNFGTAPKGSESETTISFTHYGDVPTLSNCTITGTNASDFEVRSINNSGVTVVFKPTTVSGTRNATLTINDGLGMTCSSKSISLTGTAGTSGTVTRLYFNDYQYSGAGDWAASSAKYRFTCTYTSGVVTRYNMTKCDNTEHTYYADVDVRSGYNVSIDRYNPSSPYVTWNTATPTSPILSSSNPYAKSTNINGAYATNHPVNDVGNRKIYYDNSASGFTNTLCMLIGRDKQISDNSNSTYSKAYKMSAVTNTKLYYYAETAGSDNWHDVTYYAVIGTDANDATISGWSSSNNWGSSSISTKANSCGNTAAYTSLFGLIDGNVYLASAASKTNGAMTIEKRASTAASGLNSDQTIKYSVSFDGSDTYSELSSGGRNTPAQIQISAYKFVDGTYSSVSNTSNSRTISAGQNSTVSAYVPAAYTGATSLSYTSVNEHFTWIGWYDAANGGNAVSSPYHPKSASVVYARLKAKKYTITYDANDGSCDTEEAEATAFTSVTLPSATRDGYTFDGWYDEETKIGDAGDSYSPTADIELSAHWTEITHIVTLANDGHGHVEIGGATVTSVSDVGMYAASGTITAVPNTGYNFDSWSGDINDGVTIASGSTTSATITINATADSKTITANFVPKSCTITFDKNGGEGGDNSVGATYDADMTTVEVPHKIGYAFDGYWDDEDENDGKGTQYYEADGTSAKAWDVDTQSPTTLYAKWEEDADNEFTNADGDGDWNNPDNWSGGEVPTNSYAAVQLTGELIVSGYVHVGEIDLSDDDAKLTIEDDGTLEVAGQVINDDPNKLVIGSSADNQGTLIYDITQTAPSATINMVTKNAGASHYQYIASPIGGVSVSDIFSGSGAYTYVWKEGIGWERRGYYDEIAAYEPIAFKGKGSCSFAGQLVPGTTSHTLSFTATPTNASAQGVNMFANPLTAPIKIAAMTITGSSDGSVHVWNNGNWENYAVASAGENVIPAMQVYAILASESGSVSFSYNTAVRGVSALNRNTALKAPKRMASDIPEHITISVKTNDRDIALQLYEDEMFTNEIDKGWESIFMEGDGRFGELYAQAEEKMSILATPNLEGTVLGFVPGKASEYNISFSGDGKGYYLNDLKELKSTLIAESNTYVFSPEESTNAARFVISRTPIHKTPTGIDNVTEGSNARKQMINGTLYIIRDGRIYNAEGALVK